MKVDILDDGHGGTVIHRKKSPIRGVPFFSDWMNVLLARGAAYIVRELDTRRGSETFGQIIDKIKPTDRLQEQAATLDENGVVKIICIGCATPTPKMEMSKVRIGGLIQMSIDESISNSEIERRWKVQPVFKTGLGCPKCAARYMQAIAETGRQNDARSEYQNILNELNDLRAALQALPEVPAADSTKSNCIHGIRVAFCAVCQRNLRFSVRHETKKPAKGAGMRTAFIDVLEEL